MKAETRIGIPAEGQCVWARWCGPRAIVVDRADHIYVGAPTWDHKIGVTQACCGYAAAVPSGGLAPARGRRCKACAKWLAEHPEAVVRDTAAEVVP